jgi:hypothetical protein
MRTLRDFAIITALMALGTWFLGWWTVPLIAAAAALLDRNRKASIVKATFAAILAWGILLASQGMLGTSIGQLNGDLAKSLGVPMSVPFVLTLVLPALLAASAAGTVVGVKHLRGRPPLPSTP